VLLSATACLASINSRWFKRKLHYFDLLWICWTTRRTTATCRGFVIGLRVLMRSCYGLVLQYVVQVHDKSKHMEFGANFGPYGTCGSRSRN